MPRFARVKSNSFYYHIVSRGIGKQILFEDTRDYNHFIEILNNCQETENFLVIAYCLMDNHVHLLLRVEDGLDRIMKRILGSYSMYFNNKYARQGHLFQDRYWSEPVDGDGHLLGVARYIHNNPQKAGLYPREKYPYSSWREYAKKPNFVSTSILFEIAGGREAFFRFSEANDDIDCLDVSDKGKISDSQALNIIYDTLGLVSGTELQRMSKKNRNVSIHLLKNKGLSLRQIERLTGISKSIIQRV